MMNQQTLFTAKTHLPSLAELTKPGDLLKDLFGKAGGKECYMLHEYLYVHFDTEEDLVAWCLTWTPKEIQRAYYEQLEANLEKAIETFGFDEADTDRLRHIVRNHVDPLK